MPKNVSAALKAKAKFQWLCNVSRTTAHKYQYTYHTYVFSCLNWYVYCKFFLHKTPHSKKIISLYLCCWIFVNYDKNKVCDKYQIITQLMATATK